MIEVKFENETVPFDDFSVNIKLILYIYIYINLCILHYMCLSIGLNCYISYDDVGVDF